MDVTVVSHMTIDHIQSNRLNKETVGGPVTYSGLMIKSFSHDVNLLTKIGIDFDYKDLLSRKGLFISDNCQTDELTTRFKIVINGNERKLFLLARCVDLTVHDVNVDSDGCIVSPIIGEVNCDVINKLSKRTNIMFLDPQGLLRKVRDGGRCYVEKSIIDLSKLNIDVIKVDKEEAFALTGLRGIDAIYKLYVKTAIMTIDNRTLMLHNQHLYEIITETVDAIDSTGAGDIFAGAYVSAYMKSNDVQWALCHGVAASIVALKTNKVGIEKLPARKEAEEYASILHNNIRSVTR